MIFSFPNSLHLQIQKPSIKPVSYTHLDHTEIACPGIRSRSLPGLRFSWLISFGVLEGQRPLDKIAWRGKDESLPSPRYLALRISRGLV